MLLREVKELLPATQYSETKQQVPQFSIIDTKVELGAVGSLEIESDSSSQITSTFSFLFFFCKVYIFSFVLG